MQKRKRKKVKSFLNLLEENPHFLKIYAERYLGTLNNMLIDSLSIGNYDTLEEGLNRLIQTTKLKAFSHIKNIESRVFRQRYLLLLNWCLGQKDFEKALKWIPEIEQGLEIHEKNIEKHHRITFYYLNAYLLFLNKHFDEALNWCNNILNQLAARLPQLSKDFSKYPSTLKPLAPCSH